MRVSAVRGPAVSSEIRSKSSSHIPKTLCCVKRTPTPSVVLRECQKTCVLWHNSNNSHAKFNKRLMRHCYRGSYKWPRMLWAWEALFNTTTGDKGFTVAYEKKKRAYIYIYLYKYVCVSFLNKLSYLCQLSPSRNIRRIKDFLLTFCCLEMLSITRTRGTFRAYSEYQKIQRSGICILITASRYTIPTVHFMEEML